MPRRALFASLVLPLLSAAWAGCSSKQGATTADDAPGDAGPDGSGGPSDGGVDAPSLPPPPVDCNTDFQADGMPTHLECAGLYDDFQNKVVSKTLRPYAPGVVFWSDGAEKSRFLYLPPGTTIDTTDFDNWSWPRGTKVFKEFKVDGKRVETRMFEKYDFNAWRRTVYRWNATENDAVRMEVGELVPRADGPPYEIPATGNCDLCHAGRPEPMLGLEPVGLGLATASGVTLAELAADGFLSQAPPQTSFAIPDDATGKAAAAIGWLHGNCGPCHNALSGQSGTNLHLLLVASQLTTGSPSAVADADGLDAYTSGYCKKADRENDAGAPWTYIAGGSPPDSLVSFLSGERAPEGEVPTVASQMPPIITHRIDPAGHAALDDWISALPACP